MVIAHAHVLTDEIIEEDVAEAPALPPRLPRRDVIHLELVDGVEARWAARWANRPVPTRFGRPIQRAPQVWCPLEMSPEEQRLLPAVRHPGEIELANINIVSDGYLALGSALMAMPASTLLAIKKLSVSQASSRKTLMTAAAGFMIADALRPGSGLTVCSFYGHPNIGDAAVAALMRVLPPTLRYLDFNNTGCGDTGMRVLTATLPSLPLLATVSCQNNHAVGGASWAAFAEALPACSLLQEIRARRNSGMGSVGALAFASVLPRMPSLTDFLVIEGNGASNEANAELKKAWQTHHLSHGGRHVPRYW